MSRVCSQMGHKMRMGKTFQGESAVTLTMILAILQPAKSQLASTCTAHSDCVTGQEACLNACWTAAFGGAACQVAGPGEGNCQPCALCNAARSLNGGCGSCPPPPTFSPTSLSPTRAPTAGPTDVPTTAPVTQSPTRAPVTPQPTTAGPTRTPTASTQSPTTDAPTSTPTAPTSAPTQAPVAPTTSAPSRSPTLAPTRPPVVCLAGSFDLGGRCTPCAIGTYSAANANQCSNCSQQCARQWDQNTSPFTVTVATEFVQAECTPSSDLQCTEFRSPSCPVDTWILAEPTLSSDVVCQPCTSCSPGNFVSIPCTAYSDTVCSPCQQSTGCPTNQFEATPCTATSDKTCLPLTTCASSTEFSASSPTLTSDRRCQNVTVCLSGEHEVQPPSATTDRQCAASTDARTVLCALGSTWSPDPNPVQCLPVSTCSAGTFAVAEPTVSSDRRCLTCVHGTFQPDSSHNHAECRLWTPCELHHYTRTEGTTTSDQQCALCGGPSGPRCPSGQFESAECTSTTDRVCSFCTGCSNGIPHTACNQTHDDVCVAPVVAVIAGSPTARNLAGAETEEYRSDDEIWATALSVFFILLLLLLLLLFLLFRRDAAKRDKSYLAAATKEFWWGLEEEVEVTGPNVAELKARRSAKLLAGEIDKEVMTRACRLLVLELADLAVAESRFKTHVRRDMELSRQIHITRTVVDRFSAAQRDIAKNTTDMGTRHEHHSRKVDEAIEAVREELRLLDEVFGLSPEEVSARCTALELELEGLSAKLENLAEEEASYTEQREADDVRAEELRNRLAQLRGDATAARDRADVEERERLAISAEVDRLRAELEDSNSHDDAARAQERKATELAAAATAAKETWDATERERQNRRRREMEKRLEDLAEELKAQRAAELARLQEEARLREEARLLAEEEARRIAWRTIQQRKVEEEETPGLLGSAQMMLFGGGRIKKARPPPRIFAETIVTDVVRVEGGAAGHVAKFDPDYVPTAEELARLGVQADIESEVTERVHANSRVSEAIQTARAAKKRAAQTVLSQDDADSNTVDEGALDAAAEQRLQRSIESLELQFKKCVLDVSHSSTTAQQFASRAARVNGAMAIPVEFQLTKDQVRGVLGAKTHARLFKGANFNDVVDTIMSSSRSGIDNIFASEFLERVSDPATWVTTSKGGIS